MRNRRRGARTRRFFFLAAVSACCGAALWAEDAAPGSAVLKGDVLKGVLPPAPAKPEAPLEYRGAAQPLESSELDSLVRRAEEHFQAEEWARGLAVFDEVLAGVTAPPGKKKPPSLAEKEKEKKEKEMQPAAGGRRQRVFRRGRPVVSTEDAGDEPAEVAPRDAVSSADGIRFAPMATALRRRLLELSEEVRAIYRRTYEAPARQALEKALAMPPEKARTELRRVGERYPLAPPGAEAWKALAERLLGAGRAAEAARAFEVRLELPFEPADPSAARATILAQAAAAYAIANLPGSATRCLDEIARSQPETMVAVRGEAVPGHALKDHPLFRDLLQRSAPAGTSLFAWHTGPGTFDHAAFPFSPESLPALGSQAKWIHRLAPDPDERNGRRAVSPFAASRGASLGATIFIRHEGALIALDAHAGKVEWVADPSSLGEHRGPARAAYQQVFSEGPEDAASTVSIVAPRRAREDALVVCVNRSLHMGETESGQTVYEPNLLAAFHARTGKLAWTFGERKDERDPARGLAFTAAPVVESGLILLPAARGESLYAAAVTPAGKMAWVRRLYTHNPAYQNNYSGVVLPGLQLAAAEGTVVAASGHGLVVALDASSGEVLWSSRYRSTIRQGYFSGRYSPVPAPPIISGSTVLAMPPDSDYLTAFDLRTGRILWDRKPTSSGRTQLLGATRELVFVGGEKIHAMQLGDGKNAWTSAALSLPGGAAKEAPANVYEEYAPLSDVTSALVVSAPRGPKAEILAAARDGSLVRINAKDGKTLSTIRFSDSRMSKSEPIALFLAEGEIVARTMTRVFALEPQAASWSAAGDAEGRNLFPRVRLLRSEGRFDEALATLGSLEKSLQSKSLVESVQKDIVVTARAAATATGRARYITDLLARKEPLVKERRDVLALRLLEARLLEDKGDLQAAGAAYLALSSADGVVARAADGTDVDVGTYACDSLREMKAKHSADSSLSSISDSRGEEWARELASRTTSAQVARAASFLLLRRPHLEGTAALEARLAAEAEADGDLPRALEMEELRLDDFPALRDDPTLAARREKLAPAIPGETPLVGLAELLEARRSAGGAGGKGKLTQLFWLPADEGFIASQAASSAPLPAIASIFGTKLRLHDNAGKLILERPLPDYPDVGDIKMAMQAHIEEPAIVKAEGGDLALFTAAGIYSFRGLGGAAGAAGLRPRDFKLAWARTWTHPLTELGNGRYSGWWGGGIPVPNGRNFFAEVAFGESSPIVLLGDGTIFSIDARTGKLEWRLSPENGAAASPPLLRGPWIVTRAASPGGLSLQRRPSTKGGGSAKSTTARFLPGSEGSIEVSEAILAAGGLAAVFKCQKNDTGQSIDALEAESGRLLWRRLDSAAQIAFSTGAEVWLSEAGGKLIARSVRSGRERKRVEVPDGANVVETFPETARPGGTGLGWTLVLSRNHSRSIYWGYEDRNQTGQDLYLVRLGEGGEKLWETQIHKGPVTYGGGRFLAKDGRYVLVFNADSGEEKWYTRAVAIDPANGSTDEIFSVEIHGKGTGQPPRMQLLADGIGVGNTDGFGWYALRAAAGDPPVDAGK